MTMLASPFVSKVQDHPKVVSNLPFSVLMMLGEYSLDAHRGIARFATEHGWNLNAEMAHVPVIPYGWSGHGIITGLTEGEDLVRYLDHPAMKRIPKVDIYNIRTEIPVPRVVGDQEMIGRMAGEYFLKMGWRRFAWFSRVDNPVSRLRRKAFERALKKKGFSSVTLAPAAVEKQSWQAIQSTVLADLKATGFPLAVFTYNDYDASFIQNVCKAGGLKVPDEVAVLGVDNNLLIVKCLPVHLSSIRHDLEGIGYHGAALLHHLIQGGKPPTQPHCIPPLGIAERASTESTPAQHPVIRRVIAHMKKCLADKVTVDDLIGVARMSRRSLEVAFKRETGHSLFQQLNLYRLREARRLLEQTDISISEVAKQSGFNSTPYLHREFRKHFLSTPRDWRLTILQEEGRI